MPKTKRLPGEDDARRLIAAHGWQKAEAIVDGEIYRAVNDVTYPFGRIKHYRQMKDAMDAMRTVGRLVALAGVLILAAGCGASRQCGGDLECQRMHPELGVYGEGAE